MEAIPYPNSSNWYKESPKGFQALPNGINTKVSYFQIPRVELNHAGTYVLYASNRVGTGSYRFVLNVQGNYMCYMTYTCMQLIQKQYKVKTMQGIPANLIPSYFLIFFLQVLVVAILDNVCSYRLQTEPLHVQKLFTIVINTIMI